jgi:GNAT superfamily N-acetyltransferase
MQIEALRSDFEDMSALMRRSWGGTAQGAFLYEADFLVNAYQYPGASLGDAAACYIDGELQGFLCAFPRKARFGERVMKLQCLTFLTCAPEQRGQGIGSQLWRECLVHARDRGYDGCIYYFQDRSPTEAIAARAASTLGCGVHRLLSFGYLGKALGGLSASAGSSAATPPITDAFLEMAGTLPAEACMSRVWSRIEADWQCNRRVGGLAETQSSAEGAGVLTGYVMPLDDPGQTRICVLEDVLYQRLPEASRQSLISELLGEAASRGATTAIVPLLGYADMSAFRALGFRRLLRKMHAEVTLFDASSLPERGGAIYMDVF